MNELVSVFSTPAHPLEPAGLSLFALLNPHAEPNPVVAWSQREWLDNAIPLYVNTPMASILPASPWLVELPPARLAAVLTWAEQADPSWGWLYVSVQPWRAQHHHWQGYLRVMIDDQLKALRFHDPRLLATWLPSQTPSLWADLLAPVEALRLPTGEVVSRLAATRRPYHNDQTPWVLPTELIEAWHRSDAGINSALTNLVLQLWETRSEVASQWDSEPAPFTERLRPWLQRLARQGHPIRTLTLDDALTWLASQASVGSHGQGAVLS